MPRPALPALAAALLALAGCRSTAQAQAGEVDRATIYQTIADALPRLHFGWGEAPAVVELAASTRAEGPPPALEPLIANERGFRMVVHVYRPRSLWVPYSALVAAHYEWRVVPNVIVAPLLLVPMQVVRATIVLDTEKLPGFQELLAADLRRLEALSREVGLGGPWAHAEAVRAKLAEDAADHGPGRLALHVDRVLPVPAWLPWTEPARRTARAFAWAAAHPDLPPLEDEQDGKAEGKGGRAAAEKAGAPPSKPPRGGS